MRYTLGGALVARNLQTGTEKQILSGGFFSWALSPDGKRIAVSQQSVLKTIPAVGGEAKELVSGKGFLRDVA